MCVCTGCVCSSHQQTVEKDVDKHPQTADDEVNEVVEELKVQHHGFVAAREGSSVNWEKSEALPLMKFCPTTLFQAGRFRWPKQGLKYLGIIFPPDSGDIMKEDFDPLIQRLDIDVKCWSPLYLSLWGKVNVIKLNCVPRINYLFQSLPVGIPGSYFKRLNIIFNIKYRTQKKSQYGIHL